MKILLTGGGGRLGTELQKLIQVDAPSKKDFNITKLPKKLKRYDLIIHAAAYTDVVKAETERDECFDINVRGTENLLSAYPNTPFIYISSEYAVNPVNYYSETKQIAERKVVEHQKHLIIRTLFKPRPFPFDKSFMDQYTMGDYVDVIAKLILREIVNWDLRSKLVYVGTGRKTIHDLAIQTRPDAIPISIKSITEVTLPFDYV